MRSCLSPYTLVKDAAEDFNWDVRYRFHALPLNGTTRGEQSVIAAFIAADRRLHSSTWSCVANVKSAVKTRRRSSPDSERSVLMFDLWCVLKHRWRLFECMRAEKAAIIERLTITRFKSGPESMRQGFQKDHTSQVLSYQTWLYHQNDEHLSFSNNVPSQHLELFANLVWGAYNFTILLQHVKWLSDPENAVPTWIISNDRNRLKNLEKSNSICDFRDHNTDKYLSSCLHRTLAFFENLWILSLDKARIFSTGTKVVKILLCFFRSDNERLMITE